MASTPLRTQKIHMQCPVAQLILVHSTKPSQRPVTKGVCPFDRDNWMEQWLLFVHSCFILLASSTSFYILLDVLLESRPPKFLANREVCGCCPWMSCNWMVVMAFFKEGFVALEWEEGGSKGLNEERQWKGGNILVVIFSIIIVWLLQQCLCLIQRSRAMVDFEVIVSQCKNVLGHLSINLLWVLVMQ